MTLKIWSKQALAFGTGLALLASGGYLANDFVSGRDFALSERPAEIAGQAQLNFKRDTVLAATFEAPLDAIEQSLERHVPQSQAFGGNSGRWARYRGTVSRAGPIAVAGGGDRLHLSVPLRIKGSGGLRGDVARMLGLHKKNFTAGVMLKADVHLSVGRDWRLSVDVTPDFRWTSPARVEVVTRAWVDVSKHVEPAIRDALSKFARDVPNMIDRDVLRTAAMKVWRTHRLETALEGVGPVVAHLTPKTVGFTGLHVDGRVLRAGLSLAGATEVTLDVAATAAPMPELPALEAIEPKPGGLDLALPLRASYATLETALSDALVDEQFSADTGAGKASLVVRGVEVFPSADKLTVGVRFEGDAPGRIFDVKGVAYLSAKPVLSDDGRSVQLADVTLRRSIDNDLVGAVSAVLAGPIQDAIADASTVEFGDEIDAGLVEMEAALAKASASGEVPLVLQIKQPRGRITAIAIEADALAIGATLSFGLAPVEIDPGSF